METLKGLVEKQRAFQASLKELELEKQMEEYSQEELELFVRLWGDVPTVAEDAKRIIQKKKEQRAHMSTEKVGNSVVGAIDFLSEREKEALKAHLAKYNPGEYVLHFHGVTSEEETEEKITNFLIREKVVEAEYVLECPDCANSFLSKRLTQEQMAKVFLWLRASVRDEEALDKYVFWVCEECDYDMDDNPSAPPPFRPILKVLE